MPDDEKLFLSVSETARLLDVHVNTVRNWVTSGTLVSARLPGSKQHRFAREEVMRLAAQRGTPTSSVAPQLRVDEPDLVSANQLDDWAAQDDAKGAFPDLVRRLLALTPGISNIDIRAHEGIAAPGWDGSATSAGSPFLPAGELRFEFGTEKDSKGKAQSDYDNRVRSLPADKDAIFVFGTPRNWARGRIWAADRAEEKKFKGVKAIDAHVLEGWLRATPSVHYWLSERLGLHPRDAQTIARWWEAFQGRVLYKIPARFFAAGRAKEVDLLLGRLKAGRTGDPVPTVQAPWRDESLAFVYAALESDAALVNRTVVVTDSSAWRGLVESPQQMILVPLFDGSVDIKAAEDRGHRVILVAGGDDTVRDGSGIKVPKVDRVVGEGILKEIGIPSDQTAEMVALARRSMPAFFRSIAREPRYATPDWVKDKEASSVLAPLLLAGSWTDEPGDAGILEQLTATSAKSVDRLLKTFARGPDAPPFVSSGGHWRPTSPAEGAYLLLGEMSPSDLERWRGVVLQVLLAEDPLSDLDTGARLAATAAGSAPPYSSRLQSNLAQGLALAAATADNLPPSLQMQRRVNEIVQQLLDRASADRTGDVWRRLAPFLPALAEAAPEVFQDVVESELAQPEPTLRKLFRDAAQDDGFFGPTSPHHGLLWALETLCISPDYFGRAAGLLAQVAAIDPGGAKGGRPIDSLQKVTSGWVAQSGATVDDKILLVERAIHDVPDVGWSLLLEVWPGPHMVAFAPHMPIYRDWAPKKQSVTHADWDRFVEAIVRLAVFAMSDRADRWMELIPKLDDLRSREQAVIFSAFREVCAKANWTEDERYSLWSAFAGEVAKHEEFADAEWAMSSKDLEPWKEVVSKLAPNNDPRLYSRLFDWRAQVPGFKLGSDGYHEKLSEIQHEAICEVLDLGVAELEKLINDVPIPGVVGSHLSKMSNAPGDAIIAWLETDVPNLREAALAYARDKLLNMGARWLSEALASTGLNSHSAREALMAAVPFSKTFWTEVDDLEESLSAAYWQRVLHYQVPEADRPEAVDLLLSHHRPWQAVGLLGDMLHANQAPEIELVKKALSGAIAAPSPVEDRQMSSYYVGTLLEYMEREVPDDPELPTFEFMFFEFTHEHQPCGALYRVLGRDSAEFVNLVKAVYRGDGEPSRQLTAQERAYAGRAWSVLHHWPVLPGLRPDGTIDGVGLEAWVREVRQALADEGRAAVGDEQVGQVLASSPQGSDGVWPAEEVREIVEDLVNTRIDTGIHIGRINQRGVTSRGVFDGGDQERALEQEYRDMAALIATGWPRTARILRGIADSYQQEARHHDADAERRGDGG